MKLTKEMLIDWIDRPPSNSDLDLIYYIIRLQNNRDKAIEINKYIYDNLENMDFGEVKCKINRVLDILKGDSDE